MSRRNKLQGLFANTAEELAMANFEAEETKRAPAGPVRSMALTLGRMEDEAKALQDALASGRHVQDLDPGLVDESFIRDRIGAIELSEDDEFVRSIAENGQEVPILVRPHPEKEGRYQTAYGHRRLAALRILGRSVKAVVRDIADDELVVAQGIENTARNNLSYIERAVFAHNLEEKGFRRPVIMKALTTDKTELSKLISVASGIPDDLIVAIGNAPSVGRRRWIAFAKALQRGSPERLNEVIASEAFKSSSSDERFEMALKALTKVSAPKTRSLEWKPKNDSSLTGVVKTGTRSYTLSLSAGDAASFGKFITEKLDELYQEFSTDKSGD